MSVKDELHALVDQLSAQDADEVVEFLRWRVELATQPSEQYIAESLAALEEATAPGAVHIPNEAVVAWLKTWGTPDEEAAYACLQALETRLADEARGTSAA